MSEYFDDVKDEIALGEAFDAVRRRDVDEAILQLGRAFEELDELPRLYAKRLEAETSKLIRATA